MSAIGAGHPLPSLLYTQRIRAPMNAMRLNGKRRKWELMFQSYNCYAGLNCYPSGRSLSRCSVGGKGKSFHGDGVIRRYLSNSPRIPSSVNARLLLGSSANWISPLRCYSSEGDGRNASEDKQAPVKEFSSFDDGSSKGNGKGKEGVNNLDAHAQLGEQDQKAWIDNEKLAIENKKKESPFLTKQQRFKNQFLQKIVPWEKQTVTWDTFPYYIHENSKNLLVECASSHLKNKKFASKYGSKLASSSGRILLQSESGTQLYRERFVRALAHDLQASLLVLDSGVLAAYDFGEDQSENESEDEQVESGEERTSESEAEDEPSNKEEWTSGTESKSDDEDFELKTTEAMNLIVKFEEEYAKNLDVIGGTIEEVEAKAKTETSEEPDKPLKKGDRIKYVGPSVQVEEDSRFIASGVCGEIFEIKGDKVAVILDDAEDKTEGEKEEEKLEQSAKAYWLNVHHVERDVETESDDSDVAMEALSQVIQSVQPLVVYFPDLYWWLSKDISKSDRKEFLLQLQEMFDQTSGPVVFICGQTIDRKGSNKAEQLTMVFPSAPNLSKLFGFKKLVETLKTAKKPESDNVYKLFENVVRLYPPKEENLLVAFNKQIEEDRRIVVSRSNINELYKVLERNELSCMDLLHVNTDGVVLTRKKAENVVGWAKNHYLSTCSLPSVKSDRLSLPYESIQIAISRLREQEKLSKKPALDLKNLAKDDYESNFISTVVPPDEIGVKFDDIGALEDVKATLQELAILPMKRPELFTRGNLLRPCKGLLLFGPPGTGKTLLAKALATEAGANFMNITSSTITSKWFGDAEKLTKALFSFARKLAPVIVFIDEVDSVLGARGGGYEHEATRKMRNEFMAAWDGFSTKDSQRILILGATNRPFDLDDAVIRRLPRRIFVDLPDAGNRLKILKILLAQEHLEAGFDIESLANATEGYSGSDLKNLCIAAAYRPVQEFLDEEKRGNINGTIPGLRPLNLDDFVQSTVKVGPSVAYDAMTMNELRKWNEQFGEGGSRRRSPFGF